MRKLTFFVFFLIFIPFFSKAQVQFNSVAFASPNAAQLGSFDQVKVNYFNGLPNINIPLFNLSVGGCSIPLTLGYHSGGIKKDERPTWVGLGWNLFAGGAITRIAHGKIDEYYNTGQVNNNNPEFYSYLYNKSKLLGDNWVASNVSKESNLDLAPDEFQFSFNGISGKFYMDGMGNFQVKSNMPQDIKVDYELKAYPELKNFYSSQSAHIPRIFYRFTLTTADGVKYVFGNDKDAIEYSRASTKDLSNGYPNLLNIPNDDGCIIATSWYLKEIILLNGQRISFAYVRDGYQMVETRTFQRGYHHYQGCWENSWETTVGGNMWMRNLINSVYLKSITAYDGTSLEFSFGPSVQLGNDVSINGNEQTFFEGYHDLVYSSPGSIKNKMVQLNKIHINHKGVLKKQVVFDYTSNATERLKLLQVQIMDANETIKEKYSFTYNLNKLPSYNYGGADHWGYYNQPDYFFDVNDVTTSNAASLYPGYLQYLEPNEQKAQAEILTAITYPTGGETRFYYELNDYGAQMQLTSSSFSMQPLGQTKHCGGLRVREVVADPFNSGTPLKTIYKYVKDYSSGGTHSSGILSGIPDYWISGAWESEQASPTGIGKCTMEHDFWIFNTKGYEPLSQTNGNHVTYSEVAEVFPDGSYKVYNYSNHDNPAAQFVDQFPENFSTGLTTNATSAFFFKTLCFTKMEFERGMLLKEVSYTPSHIPKQEVTYTYNVDAGRYANFVRAVETFELPIVTPWGTPGTIITVSCTKEYLFNPNITRIETKNLEAGGDITSILEYVYDHNRNISEKRVTNSKGEIKIEQFAYPYNFAAVQSLPNNCTQEFNNCWSGCANVSLEEREDCRTACRENREACEYAMDQLSRQANIYRRMTDAHVLGEVVEQRNILRKSGVDYLTGGSIATFQEPFTGLYKAFKQYSWESAGPVAVSSVAPTKFVYASGLVFDSRYKERASVSAYDSYGNVLQMAKFEDINQSYVWGYNQAYPIAQATNAKHYEVFYWPFEGGGWEGLIAPQYGDLPVNAYDPAKSHTGRTAARIDAPSPGVEHYSHSDKKLSINLTAPTKFKLSGWVYSTGPSVDIYLFMKRQYESFYYSYVDYVTTAAINKWVYMEKEITVPADVKELNVRIDNNGGGSVWFDDIRLHPSNAQMATYTYEPLIGVSSVTDANNRTTHYRYDNFGRLALVQDQDKNVLKKYCYNYQGQPEDCNVALFYNTDQSGYYYPQHCAANQIAQPYYVSVPMDLFPGVTLEDANSRARQYGQQEADRLGTCAVPSVTLFYSKEVEPRFLVSLLNLETNQNYEFEVTNLVDWDFLGVVPRGYYDINIYSPENSSDNFAFSAFGFFSIGNSFSIAGVYLDENNTHLEISWPQGLPLLYLNATGQQFTVALTNLETSDYYQFNLNGSVLGMTQFGQVPQGYYQVLITGNTSINFFFDAFGYYSQGNGAYISFVYIDASNNYIYIDYP